VINNPCNGSTPPYPTTLLNNLSCFRRIESYYQNQTWTNQKISFWSYKILGEIQEFFKFLYLWKLKGSCFKFHSHYRTHPLTSFEAVECLFPKITDFVAIISIGYTWRSFLIFCTTASDTVWRKSFFLHHMISAN